MKDLGWKKIIWEACTCIKEGEKLNSQGTVDSPYLAVNNSSVKYTVGTQQRSITKATINSGMNWYANMAGFDEKEFPSK